MAWKSNENPIPLFAWLILFALLVYVGLTNAPPYSAEDFRPTDGHYEEPEEEAIGPIDPQALARDWRAYWKQHGSLDDEQLRRRMEEFDRSVDGGEDPLRALMRQSAGAPPDVSSKQWRATETLARLVKFAPDQAWPAILEILRQDEADKVRHVLAAGPLEDFLNHHGPAWIARLEAQAKQDPRFAHLLGGVWPSEIDAEVWKRVEKARPGSW